MSSLKEEIEKHIHYRFYEGNAIPYADKVTNEILEIFEKRIDLLKQHLLELKDPKDGIDPLKDYHCYDACIKTLDKMKEMLK